MKNRFGLFCGISLVVVDGRECGLSPGKTACTGTNVMIYKIEHERMMQGHPHPMPPEGILFSSPRK